MTRDSTGSAEGRGQVSAIPANLNRRTALSLMSAGAALATTGLPRLARAAMTEKMPWLASPEQLEAERMLLKLMQDPDVKAIQAKLRADLSDTPRAKIPDAAATLAGSVDQWSRSLIFAALMHRPKQPIFLWATDDTPREWLGHKLGGVGTSGDNPDDIYRTSGIEGGGRYEILGRYYPDSRPVQLLIEVDAGDMAEPAKIMGKSSNHTDIKNAVLITDKDLVVAPDGSFRITLSSADDKGWAKGPNHYEIPSSGYCMVGVRDILANWNDRACHLTIRRLDPVKPEPWNIEEVRKRVLATLYGYVHFWAHFPDMWFGGLKANTKSDPMGRPGSWGFVAGLNFSLAPDEGLLVTTVRGPARYTGFQLTNPWMISPDARLHQVCLNISQTTPNPDGTYTYVIAMKDPGVANWLDTAGLSNGIGIMRWQAVPPEMTSKGLVHDFRLIKLAELESMPDIPRVTPAQRKAQLAARGPAYTTRER